MIDITKCPVALILNKVVRVLQCMKNETLCEVYCEVPWISLCHSIGHAWTFKGTLFGILILVVRWTCIMNWTTVLRIVRCCSALKLSSENLFKMACKSHFGNSARLIIIVFWFFFLQSSGKSLSFVIPVQISCNLLEAALWIERLLLCQQNINKRPFYPCANAPSTKQEIVHSGSCPLEAVRLC